jgi:hypothetical protein
MKIKELFKSVGVSQSIGGTAVFLDRENCVIENKTKNEDSVLLHLKRESDGEEGHAYLRVKDEYKELEAPILNWAFNSVGIMGLTLNELEDMETNLAIQKTQGRISLKSN